MKCINVVDSNKQDENIFNFEDNSIVEPITEKISAKKRVGVAKGKFKIPAEFDEWDEEIEEMFTSLKNF